MPKKQKPKRSLPVRIARGVILAVVLCAAVVLVLRLLEYKQGADVYGQLQAEMGVVSGGESQTGDSEDGEEKEPPLLDIDFERLWSENQEVVAWLEFPALHISYPIMHTDNNDYYLSHLWNGQPNSSGSIFLDANNKSVDDLYTVVYGHNMYDGSMFGLFNRYESSEFCEETAHTSGFIRRTPCGNTRFLLRQRFLMTIRFIQWVIHRGNCTTSCWIVWPPVPCMIPGTMYSMATPS